MTATIPRHLRAWDYSQELRREQNDDARGFEFPCCPHCDTQMPDGYCPECGYTPEPGDPDVYGETCLCGSGLPQRECHDNGPCYFNCICAEQERAA